MVSLFNSDKKFIPPKSCRIPVPKVNLAAPCPGVRLMRWDQISRHSKQLLHPEKRQHKTIVDSPQQMAGNVCRFFTKIKELIIWSWSYLWALWFLLVISVVYYLRGPLKITDNIGMGESNSNRFYAAWREGIFILTIKNGLVYLCRINVSDFGALEVNIRCAAM